MHWKPEPISPSQPVPPLHPLHSISLVLPAYDEEDCIVGAVREAREALQRIATRYEILVVDDGSRDATAARVEEAFADDEVIRLLRHPGNQGYGAALRTGFTAASCELVAFTDADCQFYVEDLELLLRALPGHDVVCGYRMDRQDHPLRLFYSRVYNLLVRSLIGVPVRDLDCALKVFRRTALNGVTIRGNGFLVNTELLAGLRARGASIVEVGVRHRPRLQGQSTVSPLHAIPVLFDLLGFWWSACLFQGLDPATDARSSSLAVQEERS